MANHIETYTTNVEEVFEHIIKEDKFEFNHVIIKPNFFFPKHPTDADVTITVIRGHLSIALEEGDRQVYEKGHVLKIDQGTMSELGNNDEEPCELFVIKRR